MKDHFYSNSLIGLLEEPANVFYLQLVVLILSYLFCKCLKAQFISLQVSVSPGQLIKNTLALLLSH